MTKVILFKQSRTFISIVFIGFLHPSHSVAQQGLPACRALESAIERLDCYDKIPLEEEPAAAESALSQEVPEEAPPQEPQDTHAVWEKTEEKDPISDRRNVSYFASPTEPQRNQFGGLKAVFLQLRCFDNETNVVVFFDDFQISDRVEITTRLDDGEAQTSSWEVSSNRKAAGKWSGASALPFIKSLIGHKSLAVRARLGDGQDTYIFDISNVEEYAADVADACGWSLK